MKTKNWEEFLNEERIDFYSGDKKKVKIVSCSNEDSWYKDYIGEVFTVIEDNSGTKWKDNKEYWKVVPTEDKKDLLGGKWYAVLYLQKDDCSDYLD